MRTNLAHKRDKNHADVHGWFYGMGCSVFDTSALGRGFPDLVVGVNGLNLMVEVKTPAGKLTRQQRELFAVWRGKIHVVCTMDDCIALVLAARATDLPVHDSQL